MHHFADDQRADPGIPDGVGSLADGLARDQAAVDDELLGCLDVPDLQVSQDDVELIEELVVEGAHGIHHAPGAGKLVREPQGFRAVLKDQKDAGDSIILTLIPHDGDLADDQAVAADLRAPVFFRNVPSEDLFIAAVRNEVRDRGIQRWKFGWLL